MGDLFRYHLHTQIPYTLFGSIDSYRLSMFFYAVLNGLSSSKGKYTVKVVPKYEFLEAKNGRFI